MNKQLPHGVSGIIIATVVLLAFVTIGVYSGKSVAPRGSAISSSEPGEKPEDRIGPRTGSMAPALTFETLDGKKMSLEDLKGKVVFLNFWATWCGPCRQEIPELIKLHNNYKDRGLVVVGLSTDENAADLDAFLKANPLPYTIGHATREMAQDFDIKGIPLSILIDKTGKIVFDLDGYDPDLDLGKLVEKHL